MPRLTGWLISAMHEFDIIARYFRPLAKHFHGSLNLADDAALLSLPAHSEMVVTTDSLSAGVHFLGEEDAALIAQKALRVNLSDLAGMGATPYCYFLNVMLPRNTNEEWVERFAEGLKQDQQRYRIMLAGGDTIAIDGPLSLSITALGSVPIGKALKRSSAKPGDILYVSGTLGDGALGLLAAQGALSIPGAAALAERYFLPRPRLAIGAGLIDIAHAAMDISDGLLQDLWHICDTSNVGAVLYRDLLPLSQAASYVIEREAKYWDAVLGGGDDYELLFTVPPSRQAEIAALADTLGEPLTAIGEITAGNDIALLDAKGERLPLPLAGFSHF